MKFYIILMLALLSACSQFSKKEEPKLEPVKFSAADIQACQEYKKTVLDRAYSEVKGTKNADIFLLRT